MVTFGSLVGNYLCLAVQLSSLDVWGICGVVNLFVPVVMWLLDVGCSFSFIFIHEQDGGFVIHSFFHSFCRAGRARRLMRKF